MRSPSHERCGIVHTRQHLMLSASLFVRAGDPCGASTGRFPLHGSVSTSIFQSRSIGRHRAGQVSRRTNWFQCAPEAVAYAVGMWLLGCRLHRACCLASLAVLACGSRGTATSGAGDARAAPAHDSGLGRRDQLKGARRLCASPDARWRSRRRCVRRRRQRIDKARRRRGYRHDRRRRRHLDPGIDDQMGTSNLVLAGDFDAVLTLGDNQYNSGTGTEFTDYFAPTWGRFKSKIFSGPRQS